MRATWASARLAKAQSYWAGFIRPASKPAARELSGQSFFGVHPLRLFDRQVGGHLIDPGRHAVGQRPFDGEIRRVPRLARSKFGRLLFGPLLGGRKLRLERIDVGFKHSDDLIGQRAFIRIAEVLSAAIHPNASFQPSGGRTRVRFSFPSVFCHRPRLARCRTASVDTLNRSAACL